MTRAPSTESLHSKALLTAALVGLAVIVATWTIWAFRGGGDDGIPMMVQALGFVAYASAAVGMHPRLRTDLWRYVLIVGAITSVLLVQPVLQGLIWILDEVRSSGTLTPQQHSRAVMVAGIVSMIMATGAAAVMLWFVARSRLVMGAMIGATLLLGLVAFSTSDTAIAALCCMWHIIVCTAMLWWGLGAQRRLGPGHCSACGYDIRGLELHSPVCPECGEAIPLAARA